MQSEEGGGGAAMWVGAHARARSMRCGLSGMGATGNRNDSVEGGSKRRATTEKEAASSRRESVASDAADGMLASERLGAHSDLRTVVRRHAALLKTCPREATCGPTSASIRSRMAVVGSLEGAHMRFTASLHSAHG
eukprot:2934483-Pleurochrysis_carterae.AAC.1